MMLIAAMLSPTQSRIVSLGLRRHVWVQHRDRWSSLPSHSRGQRDCFHWLLRLDLVSRDRSTDGIGPELKILACHSFCYNPHYSRSGQNLPPEQRWPPAMFGAFGYPACLFFFAWSAGRTHWIWPTVSAVFFGWGSTLLFLGNLIYLSEAYGKYAASALASSDLCRTLLGGIMPLVSHGLFVNLGVDWGCTLLGCISVLFIPIPFVLYKVSKGLVGMTRCSNCTLA
jgi:hypothetical protein